MKEIVPLTDDEVLLGANIDHEFSWCAVFAGALVASAVILFLLTLGTGVGLSLFSVPQATANTARNALTGGSIYFFASLAFGFAVGGYIAGRLMGPQFETEDEEVFHASTHGLVTWALGVVMTALVAVGSGVVLTGAGLNAAAIWGSANTSNAQESSLTPSVANYWVDVLFGPAGETASTAGAGVATQQTVITQDQNDTAARGEAARILTVGLAGWWAADASRPRPSGAADLPLVRGRRDGSQSACRRCSEPHSSARGDSGRKRSVAGEDGKSLARGFADFRGSGRCRNRSGWPLGRR